MTRILFTNVNILDCTGAQPFAGEVLIEGVPHRLAPGVTLYIPGGAVHGVPVAGAPLTWFYTFAADSFADIRYRFLHET